MTQPETCTKSEFAAMQGWKPGYVSQLVKEGRMVLTPDGKRVVVAASRARIEATRDPSRQGVADRHAQARAALPPAPAAAEISEKSASSPEEISGYGYDFQSAKAKREHFAAEREHAAWRKEAGELMERGAVVAAFADAGATLRAKLESWSQQLPPVLVGQSEAAMQTTIASEVERLLHDLVATLSHKATEA